MAIDDEGKDIEAANLRDADNRQKRGGTAKSKFDAFVADDDIAETRRQDAEQRQADSVRQDRIHALVKRQAWTASTITSVGALALIYRADGMNAGQAPLFTVAAAQILFLAIVFGRLKAVRK